jgi:hypothetical protein
MDEERQMDSQQLGQYIHAQDGASQPWLLAQLRIQKLQEQRGRLSPEAYAAALADIHQDVMNLGEWWVGQEDQVF